MSFRRNADGSIKFIRGLPPMEVPGFEVDPSDPSVFYPIRPQCKRQVLTVIRIPCKNQLKGYREKEVIGCNKLNLTDVSIDYCAHCTVIEVP